MAAITIPIFAALFGGITTEMVVGGLLIGTATMILTNGHPTEIDLGKFTDPAHKKQGGEHDRRRKVLVNPEDGSYIQTDSAGDRAHGGGRQVKVFDKRGKRIGTATVPDGKIIRR